MLLALAILLIQPVTTPQPSVTVEIAAIAQPADASVVAAASPEVAPVTAADTALATSAPVTPSATVSPADALPSAPTPIVATPFVAAPAEPRKPLKNGTVSVTELMAESRRKNHMWIGLGIAEHSAATFDAWSTRHAITADGAHELNPMLKPFANNASIYAAIQAGPLVMDYLGKQMMYSRNSWIRHMWWVPQSASIVSSLLCGAHNLAVR